MKIENSFTMEDVRSFMDGYLDHERHLLADRLQKVSLRVAELGPRIKGTTDDGAAWNAKEVLAHIAVVSKFYGVMAHKVASGQMSDFGIVDSVNMRDVAGKQMAERPSEELVAMAIADHQRTIEMLRTISASALRRSVRLDDGSTMTAEEVVRFPLVGHLEMHLDQLEKSLAN